MQPLLATAEHWDSEWSRRVDPARHPECNVEKLGKIFYELTKHPEFVPMNKLEIGCGPGIHAYHISSVWGVWRRNWTGLDLSEKAVTFARSTGLNAICENIYEFTSDVKYDLFLLLDTLEHLFDDHRLAEKIKDLAAPKFTVFGNVPFYIQKTALEAGIERPMNIRVLRHFLKLCGIERFFYEIYDIDGYPYCTFEGHGEL